MEKNHYNPHRLRAVMATLLALLFGAQTVQAQTKEAYAYVSTADCETLYFYYDTNRATRNSTGNTFSMNAAGQVPDWYKHYDDPIYLREKVKKVVFDYSFRDYRPTSTCYWFASMQLLTTIEGFSNLYTQNVTDMSYMFRSCNRLTTLDFHNQSGSALNMTDNFVFNTEKVTTMKGMFSYCYGLTSLNLSGWDTGAVKDMSEMFKGCTHLETLTLGAFSTTSGSDKGWNTSKVTDMNLMFGDCSALTTIKVGSNWSTASVNASNTPFTGATKLVGGAGSAFASYNSNYDRPRYACIDGGSAAPGFLTAAYAPYVHVNGTTVTFYCDEQRSRRTTGTTYDLNDDNTSSQPGWYKEPASNNYTSVVIDPSFAKARPTTTNRWFANMANLTSFTGLEYLNTSEVTNMMYMFSVCDIVDELDFSTFNTAKVISMAGMFAESRATVLDLSRFNTSKVVNMRAMFRGCSRLTTIYASSSFSTANVTNSADMFTSCSQLKGSKGTAFSSSYVDKTYARLDGGTSAPGYFSTKPYAVFNNGTLTFYNDGKRSSKAGTTYDLNADGEAPGWYTDGNSIYTTKVVFDSSFAYTRPTTTAQWFAVMTKLTTIQSIENLNTSEVTDMNDMFTFCEQLTSIDLHSFDTGKVTNMHSMFNECKALTSLDLSSWNTSNVTIIQNMFSNCTSLTTLDLSGWNTSKVENMSFMFADDNALTTIYVSNAWNTSLARSTEMFRGCSSLVGSQGTRFNSSYIDKTYARIDGGTSSPGYLSVAPYAVFNGSTLSFYLDANRNSRTGTKYSLNAPGKAPGWYEHRSEITTVVINSSFANARPVSTRSWFFGMENLVSLQGLQYLNTSEVTDMYAMFYKCSLLTRLDLNNFNTAKVTDMQYMFNNCPKLTTIYVSRNWTTNAVTSSANMFYKSTSLVGGGGTTYDANHLDKEYARVGTQYTPGYFSYKPYVEYVASDGKLFFYCDGESDLKQGTIFDIVTAGTPKWYGYRNSITQVMFDASFANARPTSTYCWFEGMSNLTSDKILNMKYLNTSEVTDMSNMFFDCSKLETLNLMNFDTQKVKSSSYMFKGCSQLTTIYATNWNLGEVSGSMFKDCINLVGGNGTTYNSSHTGGAYARIDMPDAPGYFTVKPYVIWDATAKTLTFYNDGKPEEKTGSRYDLNTGAEERPAWAGAPDYANTRVQEVIFDPSFATARPPSTYYWFGDMGNYLTKITGIEYLNTSEVTNMGYMFYNDTKLTDLDLSHFNTAKVTNMRDMFYNCCLETIDITSFDTRNVTNMIYMFGLNSKLTTILVGSNWSTAKVTDSSSMFANCSNKLKGGAGTTWSSSNPTDKTYARIDGGTSSPGYLTSGTREPYGVWDGATKTFTHYYDWKKSQRASEGEVIDGQTYDTADEQGYPMQFIEVEKMVYDPSVAGYPYKNVCGGWYCGGMENLTTIEGIEYVNTSEERYFSNMFTNCKSLKTLDLSTFDTRKATNMSYMFSGCTSLTSLTLGENFSTENVTNMSGMLANGCAPAVIDAVTNHEGFSTANVTSMSYMFQNNSGISGLDLHMFNTAKVTNMSYMFDGCSSLTTLTVGYDWTTEAVTNSANMFRGCTAIVGGAGTTFSSSHVDAAYAHIDGGTANPGYLTGVKYEPYVVIDENTGAMTFYADGKPSEKVGITYNLPADGVFPDWYNTDGSYRVTKVVFDQSFITARPTSMYRWFNNMGALTEVVGLENLVTSEVTNMESLFNGCSYLKTLDLTTFDTHKVTTMFNMFFACQSLESIYVGSGWTIANVNDGNGMFFSCYSLVGSAGTMWEDCNLSEREADGKPFAHVDGGAGSPGLLSGKTEAYAAYDSSTKTLTFYYDGQKLVRSEVYDLNEGTEQPKWTANSSTSPLTNAMRAVIDPSFAEVRPTSTCGWFNLYKLQEIEGIEYLNTSEVTVMNSMFARSALSSIDLSHFDTRKVTSMRTMFWATPSLTELDLSSFNTENVTDMRQMFAGYNGSYPNHLTTIYVGDGWNTDKVTLSTNMFSNCTAALVGGAGTVWSSSNPLDKTYARVDQGPGSSAPGYLTYLGAYAVFNEETYTLTFYYDGKRNEKVGTVYNLPVADEIPGYNAYAFTKAVFDASFANARPTSTRNWFIGCASMTEIVGLKNLNTSEVTDMNAMFAGCRNLTMLDLSHFNTAKVTNMREMFNICESLTTIYVGDGWSTEALVANYTMFNGCTSLVGGAGTTCDGTNNIEATYAHIDGGPDNPGYFTAKPVFQVGDVNKDGSISIADVTALVNIILGKTTSYEQRLADVNLDGSVSIADVTALVNIILGK